MPAKQEPPTEPPETRYLRIARLSRGMTQAELAKKSGVSQVAISHIETYTNPRKNPRRSTQRVLAWALDYTVEDVFPPDGKRSASAELRKIEKRERARNRRT